jgi:predicted MFS family arabinose efflux permease
VVACLYLSTFIGISLLPNYLHDRLGLDSATVSALGTGAAVVGVAGSLGLARLARRRGEHQMLATAEGMLIAGFALTLLAPALGALAVPAGGLGFALRGGIQAQQILARARLAAVASAGQVGPAFALLSLIFNLASTIGPAIAGIVYTVDPAAPLAIGLVTGLLLILWMGAPRRVPS